MTVAVHDEDEKKTRSCPHTSERHSSITQTNFKPQRFFFWLFCVGAD